MKLIAWTIRYPGREDILGVTTIADLRDVLRVLELPGRERPEFITHDMEVADHGSRVQNQGGRAEWSLTWTTVDDGS